MDRQVCARVLSAPLPPGFASGFGSGARSERDSGRDEAATLRGVDGPDGVDAVPGCADGDPASAEADWASAEEGANIHGMSTRTNHATVLQNAMPREQPADVETKDVGSDARDAHRPAA